MDAHVKKKKHILRKEASARTEAWEGHASPDISGIKQEQDLMYAKLYHCMYVCMCVFVCMNSKKKRIELGLYLPNCTDARGKLSGEERRATK